MKLHTIQHDNDSQLWCGPAAISAITGRGTSEIHAVIRRLTGKPSVMGLAVSAMERTLRTYGFTPVCVYRARIDAHPTLAKWLRDNRTGYLSTDRIYLVLLTTHYILLQGRRMMDNHTRKLVFSARCPHRRCRVEQVFEITSTPGTGKPEEIAAALAPVRREYATNALCKARALARPRGIQVERDLSDPNMFWVWPPPELQADEVDPFADLHACYSGDEVLQHVQEYIRKLDTLCPR